MNMTDHHSESGVSSRVQFTGNSRIEQALNLQLLRHQNLRYKDSGGISQNNRSAGFIPGFFNTRTGTSVVSRFANGKQAPIHLLDGLPETWVSQRDKNGKVIAANSSVVAGFLRDKQFYTREQAAHLTRFQ